MITIVPYQSTWPDEFLTLGGIVRRTLADLALRIDHIGSTSVPGLAAKDVIDIQVTVSDLDPAVETALNQVGYARIVAYTRDHLPPGREEQAGDWVKWTFKHAPPRRPANLHVRLVGRPNQRYALLFRDYLRAHPATAQAYAQVKNALARYHSQDEDAYYDIKDPACDLIMGGAEVWAAATRWEPGPTDC
jgi:GrpB-like predicted nucleotidyltransferase (UPF0157 family)